MQEIEIFKEQIRSKLPELQKLFHRNSRILNITHKSCMDGCGTEIVLKNIFNNVTCFYANYNTVDEAIERVVLRDREINAYDVILISDISPETHDNVVNMSDKIVLIDHHETASRFHNPDKLRFVHQSHCGTYLLKVAMEIVTGADLSYMNDLINIINDYDMWIHDDPRSRQLSMIFYDIWNEKFAQRFFEGVVEFTNEEKEFIRQREHEITEEYKNTEVFEFDLINGCFIISNRFVNDTCDKLLHKDGYDVVISRNSKSGGISIRSKNPDLHVGNMLFDLGIGGGHAGAGGVKAYNMEELPRMINQIETHICDTVPSMRKQNYE